MALSLLLLRRRLAWSTHQITKRRPNHLIEEFLFIESNKPDRLLVPTIALMEFLTPCQLQEKEDRGVKSALQLQAKISLFPCLVEISTCLALSIKLSLLVYR